MQTSLVFVFQGAQAGEKFAQEQQLPKSEKGYWAGRVPGTPVSHADD